VSYCLGLPFGYTTFTLPEVTHPIDKEELQPGDIMLCQSEHVVFFGGWTDASHASYVAYQEPGCHTQGPHYAFKSIVPYPFNWNPSCFLPYRSNTISDADTCPTSNLASKKDLLDAMFNPASFPLHRRREAEEAANRQAHHINVLKGDLSQTE
jgi:hypothetical protein